MKKTFTILHTNDMHSSLVGMGPASDYTPFGLGDDNTRGGFARLAGLIAKRKEARTGQGPVLVLDAGDYSMGTAFGAATRETGGELQLMFQMGYDATTFGNHDFDLGPEGLARRVGDRVVSRWQAGRRTDRPPPDVDARVVDMRRRPPTHSPRSCPTVRSCTARARRPVHGTARGATGSNREHPAPTATAAAAHCARSLHHSPVATRGQIWAFVAESARSLWTTP